MPCKKSLDVSHRLFWDVQVVLHGGEVAVCLAGIASLVFYPQHAGEMHTRDQATDDGARV